MTVRDRILAACAGNEEQAELVISQLERVRLLREEGRPVTGPTPAGATPPALLTEQPCPTCLHALDAARFCDCCGRQEINEARAAQPCPGARREPDQKG